MSVITGLKKLFGKKEAFAPPQEYVLNYKERESVIILFSILGCIIIVSAVLLMVY